VQPVATIGRTAFYSRQDVAPLLTDESATPGTSANAAAWQGVRNLELKNDKLEFELAALRDKYDSRVDVSQWVGEVIERARTVLSPGPSVLAPQVVPVTIPVAERIIRDWLNDALTQLHRQPS
jgi:hypothetical protein